jgi:hypothetical protein
LTTALKYFQIRALVTRYMVPLNVMNDPKKEKSMISFRKSLGRRSSHRTGRNRCIGDNEGKTVKGKMAAK